MGLDQIHEQNNKIIKGSGGASDLLNKEDDSALLRWEVCSPELARIILEFESSLDRNDIPSESKTKHHENNEAFNKRFSSDVSRLVKYVPVNQFSQDYLAKLNNLKAIIPGSVKNVLENLEKCGKEQLITFIFDRLVYKKVPISFPITSNGIEIWSQSDKEEKIEYVPSKSVLKKMISAAEHRQEKNFLSRK